MKTITITLNSYNYFYCPA